MPDSTASGIRIHYEVCGAGEPLVLVHANPADHNLWLYQISHFSTWFRVVAVDLRGYGRSDKPTAPFGFADMGADILGVLRTEGIGRTVIAGASVGATLALMLGLDHPEMFKALILVGGASTRSARAEARIEGYRTRGVDGYHLAHLRDCVSPAFFESRLGRYLIETFRERGPRLSGAAIARIFESQEAVDLGPRLATLAVPTLVVNGELDNALPAGRWTAANAPGAVHRIVAGAGHYCNLEDPAAFDAIVTAFLAAHGLMPPVG